jgi:hypothetical protein
MKVSPFYSKNEVDKPADKRVHHNNDKCEPGRRIPIADRREGTNGYRLCKDCAESDEE